MAKNILQNSCDAAGLIKIQSQTASAVTVLTFTNLAQYQYTQYKLVGFQASNTNAINPLLLQGSANNGASYFTSSYASIIGGSVTNGAFSLDDNGKVTTGLILTTLGQLSVNTNFDYTIYNVNTNSGFFSHSGTSFESLTVGPFVCLAGGYYSVLSIINAVQITVLAGTFSGKFVLYGYS